MDWEVVWTKSATQDFESVIRSLSEQSPTGAVSVRDKILKSVEMLATLPEIGPIYERDQSGRIREIISRPYRIFYRLSDKNRVEVLHIWHSSRTDPTIEG